MSKTIDTLVEDIGALLKEGGDNISDERYAELGRQLGDAVKHSMTRTKSSTLRMSSIGQPCERKLWYSINQPDEKEEYSASTYMKFMTGHILEELLLFLAEAAGHSVEGRQDEQEIEGVKGHRDAVIDGVVTDAKSASTYSYQKFEKGELANNDPFGYIDQLGSYLEAGQDDPVVTDKDRAAFLVIDKTLGHICLDIHKKRDLDYNALYRYKKSVVAEPEAPERDFQPEPDGKGGNMKLPMMCSYCDWKKTCHPDLRVFLYSNGPRFLTTVAKLPDVHEVKP